MKRRRINNKFDFIILLIFLLFGLIFSIEAIIGNLIPLKYILLFLLFIIILFISIFLTFKVRNQMFRIIRRCFSIFLCVCLLVGCIFQGQLRNAFSNVLGSINSDYMYVIVSESYEGKINDIKQVGYHDEVSDLLVYSLNELDNKSTIPYNSIDSLIDALKQNKIQSILLSAKDVSFYKSKLEGLKEIHEIEMTTKEKVIKSDLTEKPFVVYLAGIDNMGLPTQMGLHDVNMLLMVNPKNNHINIVSINRDSYVPNSKMNNYPDKLTHFGWYGPEMVCESLETVFGIEIDYYAKVTFESLIKIIDAMGGIEVDVKISFTEQDENRSFSSQNLIHLDKGLQTLNGSEALAYARHRKTAGWGVAGREKAQRDIIKAVINKMLTVEGALKLGDVLNVGASYVSTNLSMDSAKAFIKNAINANEPWTLTSSTVSSDHEAFLKCAMENGTYRSVNVLETSDVYNVHNLYESMFEKINLDEFKFDLNDINKYIDKFTLDKHVITFENYYEVVPKYFEEYLDYRF